MDLDLSSGNIKRYHDKEDIIKKTIEQIRKDFIQFGFEVEFPEDIKLAYDTLFKQLKVYIRELMNENTESLYSLLYRIDLSEKKIQQEAVKFRDRPLEEIVTHLILDRELKKVLTREYYSGRL